MEPPPANTHIHVGDVYAPSSWQAVMAVGEMWSRQTTPSGGDGDEDVDAALAGRRVRANVPSPPPDSSRSPRMDKHAT